jgi:hypothetical protein
MYVPGRRKIFYRYYLKVMTGDFVLLQLQKPLMRRLDQRKLLSNLPGKNQVSKQVCSLKTLHNSRNLGMRGQFPP